jgi:hypothetical protein
MALCGSTNSSDNLHVSASYHVLYFRTILPTSPRLYHHPTSIVLASCGGVCLLSTIASPLVLKYRLTNCALPTATT